MKVKVISELNTARGIVPTGQIIDIEPSLLERLKGKVEPLTDGRDRNVSMTLRHLPCEFSVALFSLLPVLAD